MLSMLSACHASTYWERLLPGQDTQYDETLVTYKNDANAEVALSANLYELNKDWPLTGQYEFSVPIVVAANSRRNMEYTASYGTSDVYIYGAHTLNLGDNEGVWVDIGFPFFFYGAWYTKVFITSNGFVTFDGRAYNDNGGKWTSPNPTSIPTTDDPNAILAPFWRDLDPSKGGTIEYGQGQICDFAVVWRDVPNKANSNTQTFALYFHTKTPVRSYITFVYGSITNDVPTSIGIEDQSGKQGEPVASMSSGEFVEFRDSENNYNTITKIKVLMSKLTVVGVNDEKAIIWIQGWSESRPGGTNVILDDLTEGKYKVPPIITAAAFALGTAGLLTGVGWIGAVGYLADAAILAYELSPVPRGTTVHEADEGTETAYVESAARDENYPIYDRAYDVSISPLIRWQILDPSVHHRLVITAEVTIKPSYGSEYTLRTDSIELKLTTPVAVNLRVRAGDQYGNSLTTGDVYIDGRLAGYTGSTFAVSRETHKVFVNDFWESGTGYRYTFAFWQDGSTDNPRIIEVTNPTTVTAHFNKKWCPGDVNGDGIVDIFDAVLMISAIDATPDIGDPWPPDGNWDSRCDLNGDDIIDVFDIALLGTNYGRTYP